jgi:pimeloyl-ACP methyl ester carboxylesterase
MVVSSMFLAEAADTLAERHAVYAPDLPGYGLLFV